MDFHVLFAEVLLWLASTPQVHAARREPVCTSVAALYIVLWSVSILISKVVIQWTQGIDWTLSTWLVPQAGCVVLRYSSGGGAI